MDLVENSMLDIMIVTDVGSAQVSKHSKKQSIHTIYNNLQESMFFIKARMLTDEKIGSPLRGASFKAVLTGVNDDKFIVQGSDPAQSSFGAISVPNVLIGVGKSNNFVEQFTVATFLNGTRQIREWSPIIPKSVLYVYSNMKQEPADWSLQLLVTPTSKMSVVLIVDAVLLLVIGLVIIVLYLQEKSEDEKEQVDAFNYL